MTPSAARIQLLQQILGPAARCTPVKACPLSDPFMSQNKNLSPACDDGTFEERSKRKR